jgi:hypothetical protein
MLLILVGSCGQIIILNIWLHSFPKAANINIPFTVLTSGTLFTMLVYGVALGGWVIYKRPRLQFFKTLRAFLLEVADGLTNALNGVLIVCASQFTPELLQAFLLSTMIVWTFIFMKLVFKEDRNYCSPLVLFSFLFSLAGLLVGSASKFKTNGLTSNQAWWTVIFAIGQIPGAMNGVVAAKFMRYFTLSDEELQDPRASPTGMTPRESEEALLMGYRNDVSPEEAERLRLGTDSATAKFARMAYSTLFQTIFIFAAIPTAAIPWFGAYDSVSEAMEGLLQGYRCTFLTLPSCTDEALIFFILFTVCFAMYNIGAAILNYYSPAMTSIVSQLVSPLTAVVLLIIPSWNVTKETYNVPESVFAVILIALGGLLYTAWEESTGHESPDPAASPTAPGKIHLAH